MDSGQTYYIDVVLPLNLWNSFTYEVTKDEYAFLEKGMRVAVEFGRQKIQTGLVYRKHFNKPLHYDTKPILHIIDHKPIINDHQWALFQFVSNYYLTPLGLVLKAALPSSFMLESETFLSLNNHVLAESSNLSDDEFLIVEALQMNKTMSLKMLQQLLDKKNVFKIAQNLMQKSLVSSLQEVKEKYTPKTETYLQLYDKWQGSAINELFERLGKNAPKQREILLHFFSLQRQGRPVLKKQLVKNAGGSTSAIQSLIKKEIFYETKTTIDRINFEKASKVKKPLSEKQQVVLAQIKQFFLRQKPVLLHGVTASGKTEIYIHLIEETLAAGKQVLFLVPEIALTTQLVQRLTKIFGNQIAVYHSKYSQQARREVWMNVLHHKESARIVLAARSGIFLPFQDLGLIIVDEEHDKSYKQTQPSPRYNARDLAVWLHKYLDTPVLLGSATPSIESYYNARRKRYALVELNERYSGVQLPEIKIVDLKEAQRKKRIKNHFSADVLEEITKTLAKKKQIIVFQNRRGYAPVGQCEDCGHVMECPHCDVSLTLHQHQHKLKCHYCGYQIEAPQVCPACGNPSISYKGIGTEQIQKILQDLFPNVLVDRLDSDTTRRKNGFANIIAKFQNRETDILVGTQMLVKGLDFSHVGLVVVMNADQLLFYPDFRADERSFQMLMQVAGRAGRKKEQGKVFIQTYNPAHPVLKMVLNGDYKQLYEQQIALRKSLSYPPFTKLINFQIKDRNPQKTNEAAEWLYASFANSFPKVLGPSDALVPRIKNRYIKEILIKMTEEPSFSAQKKRILKIFNSFHNITYFKSVTITIDVDPY